MSCIRPYVLFVEAQPPRITACLGMSTLASAKGYIWDGEAG